MKNKTLTLSLIIITSTFVFAACGKKTEPQPVPAEETNAAVEMEAVIQEPNSQVSQQDDLDTLEQELEETIILEEDFSDLE
jgi:predicted small lipoprotein YifL